MILISARDGVLDDNWVLLEILMYKLGMVWDGAGSNGFWALLSNLGSRE